MPADSNDPSRPSGGGRTTVQRVIHAPRAAVYQAFLEPDAVAALLPPGGMTGQVHHFDPREGGEFRISLLYDDVADSPAGAGGKTTADTDTTRGRFVTLVPDERIVQVVEFESDEPGFAGEMRITVTLADVDGGTEVTYRCENIPEGIRPEDNEAGSRSSLDNLAELLE
jgi:uncharacterized protein YndB with AHSA1/START domain